MFGESGEPPPCEVIKHHVGEIIIAYRTKERMTQGQLARAVGLKCGSSIAKIENGAQPASFDLIVRLAVVLRIDPNDFFRGLIYEDDRRNVTPKPLISTDELSTVLRPLTDPEIRRLVRDNLDKLQSPVVIDLLKAILSPREELVE